MTIPAILNDLLDYEDYERRTQNDSRTPAATYIWVKKGKKEEAWAVCSLLGLVVDRNVKVDGCSLRNTYIFANMPFRSSAYSKENYVTIGIEGRFQLRDLQIYFDQQETDNAT